MMPPQQTINVLIIDDAESIRFGFHRFLDAFADLHWIGESSDGRSVLEDCTRLHPDVILIDVMLPHLDIAETTRAVRQQFPHTQVIGLVGFEDQAVIDPILQAGAALCVSKNASIFLIAESVRKAARIEKPYLADRSG